MHCGIVECIWDMSQYCSICILQTKGNENKHKYWNTKNNECAVVFWASNFTVLPVDTNGQANEENECDACNYDTCLCCCVSSRNKKERTTWTCFKTRENNILYNVRAPVIEENRFATQTRGNPF